MAGIKDAISDVLTKLSTLDVTNQDQSTVKLFARIWNNQLQYEKEGKLQAYQKPAAFVEVVSLAAYEIIGQGFRNSDISFRIHLVHEFYNNEGTFEQDLIIFGLRDAVIKLLTGYKPAGCGPLNAMSESQSYDHDNLYEYNIDFVANFTDDKAAKEYTTKEPPTNVEIDITTRNVTKTNLFTVNQGKAYSTKYTATLDGEATNLLVLDENGNQIIEANIVSVTMEIKPLIPSNWIWNANNSTISLLGGISLGAGQSLFIIYQQNIY